MLAVTVVIFGGAVALLVAPVVATLIRHLARFRWLDARIHAGEESR
jgi:hypothetical protein